MRARLAPPAGACRPAGPCPRALRSLGCAGSRPAPGSGPLSASIRPPVGQRPPRPPGLFGPLSGPSRLGRAPALPLLPPGLRGLAAAWPIGGRARPSARLGRAPRRRGCLALPACSGPCRGPRALVGLRPCRCRRAPPSLAPCALRALRGSRASSRSGGPTRPQAAALLSNRGPRSVFAALPGGGARKISRLRACPSLFNLGGQASNFSCLTFGHYSIMLELTVVAARDYNGIMATPDILDPRPLLPPAGGGRLCLRPGPVALWVVRHTYIARRAVDVVGLLPTRVNGAGLAPRCN